MDENTTRTESLSVHTRNRSLLRYLTFALVFAAGGAVGWLSHVSNSADASPAPVCELLDGHSQITVRRDLNEQVIVLQPVNYQVGNTRVKTLTNDRRSDEELWYVELDNLLIACVRKK